MYYRQDPKSYLLGMLCLLMTLFIVGLITPLFMIVKYSCENIGIPGWFFDILAFLGCIGVFVSTVRLSVKVLSFVQYGYQYHDLYLFLELNLLMNIPTPYSDVSFFKQFKMKYPYVLKLAIPYLSKIPKHDKLLMLRAFCESMDVYYSNNHGKQRQGYSETNSNTNDQKTNAHDQHYRHCCMVLGLEEGFSMNELRRKYHQKVKQHHPDLHVSKNDTINKEHLHAMQEINEAFDYLNKEGL